MIKRLATFRQQPPYLTGINLADDLCDGLVLAAYPHGSQYFDAVSGKFGAANGTPTDKMGLYGEEINYTSTAYHKFAVPQNANLAAGFSLIIIGECDDTSTLNWAATLNDSSGNLAGGINWHGNLAVKRPSAVVAASYASSSEASSTSFAYSAGGYYLLGALCSAANAVQLAYNNTYSAATDSRANRANINNLVIGNRYDGTLPAKGSLPLVLYWDRQLTAQEWLRLYSNPWQVFRAYRRIAVNSTTGGVTNIGISDSGAGSESVSIAVDLPLSDSGAGSEAISIAASFGLSDSGSGTDSINIAAALGITDAGSGLEALDIAVSASLTDSGSGAESLAIAVTLSLTDGGSGAEIISAFQGAAINDSGSGSDSIAPPDVSLAVADIVVGAESITILATVALTDGVTGVDTISVDTGTVINIIKLASITLSRPQFTGTAMTYPSLTTISLVH